MKGSWRSKLAGFVEKSLLLYLATAFPVSIANLYWLPQLLVVFTIRTAIVGVIIGE